MFGVSCRRMAAIGTHGLHTNHLHRDLLRMKGAKGATEKNFNIFFALACLPALEPSNA